MGTGMKSAVGVVILSAAMMARPGAVVKFSADDDGGIQAP
jgi:hypothetical protein